MTYFCFNKIESSAFWSMLFYNKFEEDYDVYNYHRGDGMCKLLFRQDHFYDDMINSYSYLDGPLVSFIDPQLRYINNSYRTKSDII